MNMLNKLQTEAVNAGTLNTFNKGHIDRHFNKCVKSTALVWRCNRKS